MYRYHVEPRVILYFPRERIMLHSTEVHWRIQNNTHALEKRIDDYWNIDGSRRLVWSLDRFHTIYSTGRKSSRRNYVVRGRSTRKQLTSRTDHLWLELCTKLGRNAQLKEKEKWSNEKFQLENARKLRGLYFIDPEDKDFKETMKNVRKECWKHQSLVLCFEKLWRKIVGVVDSNKIKNTIFVYSGVWWIYETAHGKFSTESSWGPYCREKETIHYNTTIWFINLFLCL